MPVEIKDGTEINGHKFHPDERNDRGFFRCIHCGMTDMRWAESWWGCYPPEKYPPLDDIHENSDWRYTAGYFIGEAPPFAPDPPNAKTPIYPGGILPPIPEEYLVGVAIDRVDADGKTAQPQNSVFPTLQGFRREA